MNEGLKQKAVQVLKSYGFNVRTDEKYHGVDVDILAETKDGAKRVFAYVIESGEPNLGDAINLSNIREGNNKYLGRHHCAYMILAPEEADEDTKSLSDKAQINLVTDNEKFRKAVDAYSRAK